MSDLLLPGLRRAFDKARAASEARGYKYGTIGRTNEDGSVSVVVAGKPDHVYVTVDGDQASTIALNDSAPRIAGLPVRMKHVDGELTIIGLQKLASEAFLGGGVFPVAYHTHALGSGMEYPVEALRVDMGRIRFVSGLTVRITAFWYRHNGARVHWPGGNIDLTSVKPATSGHHAWVVVGVDPATNTAVAAAGTSQATGTALTVAQIGDVAFAGYIPCGAVQMTDTDTSLGLLSKYADARLWFGLTGLVAAADLTDAAIPTKIDGATAKTTPVDADVVGLVDTEDANALKKLSWANLKATLQAYFDTVYATIASLANYALLAGRAGGQNLRGGTGGSENLKLESTAHGTKGSVRVLDWLAVGGDFVPRSNIDSRLASGQNEFYMSGSVAARFLVEHTGQPDSNRPFGYLQSVGGKINIGHSNRDGSGLPVSSVARIVIDKDGNIGIGTDDPSGLEITAPVSFTAQGRDNVRLGVEGGAGRIIFEDGASATIWGIDNLAGNLRFFTAGVLRATMLSNGNFGIGGTPATSAKLDIQGSDGALLLPRLTTAQRNALTPTNGMVVFNTTLNAVETYVGGAWRSAAHQNQTTMSVSGVGGTAVTLLPAGTVSNKLQVSGVVVASDGSRSAFALGNTDPANTQLEPGAGDQPIYDALPTPSHILSLRVTAGGAVEVQRTAGTRTYSVTLTMIWV